MMLASDHANIRWNGDDLADAVASGIEARVALDRVAQEVSGIDALDEVSLHPTLALSIEKAGFGVHREQRYPSDRRARKRSEGRRCDLVLTPDQRPLQDPQAAATLFDDPDAVPLERAYWLEVKTVAQFTPEGPNAAWSGELLGTVQSDVSKLARDPRIFHAGLLIVLWTATADIAINDLGVWQDRCLDRGLPIGAPFERILPLQDRLGNACCVLRVYPIHHM